MPKFRQKSIFFSFILLASLGLIISGCLKKPPVSTNQPASPSQGEPVNQNQNTSTATITSEIDTSGWKTYRNEEYGFEFRYPGELSVKDWAYKTPNWELLLYVGQNKNISDGAVSIGVEKNIKHFDDWLILFPQDSINIRNVMIGVGNYKAKEVKVNFYSVDSKVNALNYFIESSGKLFRISYNLNKSTEVDENIFKTILSSLMFIN